MPPALPPRWRAAATAPLAVLLLLLPILLMPVSASSAWSTGSCGSSSTNSRWIAAPSGHPIRRRHLGLRLDSSSSLRSSFVLPPPPPPPSSASSPSSGSGSFGGRRRRRSDGGSTSNSRTGSTRRSSKQRRFSPAEATASSSLSSSSSSSSSSNSRKVLLPPLLAESSSSSSSSSSNSRKVLLPPLLAQSSTLSPDITTLPPALPPSFLAAAPTTRVKAIAGGFRQIWTSLGGGGGLVDQEEGGQGGGGDNTAFKVMLASVAVIYGTNFGAIKYLDEANVDVSIVTAIRFALASLALCPFLYKAPWPVVLRGIEVGLWVSTGYIAQAIGLQTTQASKSAFICSLSVVVVPIVNAIIYNKKAPPTTWLASLLAVMGVGLLTLEGKGSAPSIGDLWSLGQPLGFGIAFVRTEQCMQENKGQALAMTAAQMAAVLACSMLWVSFTLTAKTPDFSVLYEPINLAALFYTGVITSAFAVVAESVALAHISAEETTVILSTEPLWAALFGAVVLGETMNGFGYLGGGVILLGCLVTQLKLPKSLQKLLGAFGEVEEEEGEGGGEGGV